MFRLMINTMGFETCIRCLGPHMIPDGELVFHPGILYRWHAKQIVIYREGNLQVIGNTDFAPSLA